MAYKHIFITGNVRSEKFKTPQRGGGQSIIPTRDRLIHSQKLLNQLDAIWQLKKQLDRQRGAEQITTRKGTYISFTSAAEHDLITKSLEDLSKGIRLLNVKEIQVAENHTQVRATVYVPNGKEGHFISKIEKYQQEETAKGNPKNAPLVNSIEDISFALLEGLWMDNPELIPTNISKWCEAWLNVNTKDNLEKQQIAQFLTTLERIGISYKTNSIVFPERAILLIKANGAQLIELMLQSDLLAEFRTGQEPAGFWVNENNVEQQNWVDDLLERIEIVDSNVKICLLDSGVNSGHQLLQPLIDENNTLTVDDIWGTDDHELGTGHGTLMAGIAGYGKLEQLLVSQNQVQLTHKLCSVKIVPRPHQIGTPKELWGDITAQGIARAEIQNPNMLLIYCMSVTSAQDVNMGRPSSWSGAIDNLAFGEGENQRLIIISAGNIRDDESWQNYPYSNYTSAIQNPAQAWNAVVAGAFTEKTTITNPDFQNYSFLADQGKLSPYSSTSLLWEKKWSVKPDIVFEGGNLIKAPDNNITSHEDLELLSTSKTIQNRPFDTLTATSASAAQASFFAAKVAFEYPNAWPETIRGLMIHSADWNDGMLDQHEKQNNKRDITNLLRTFGYGVPNLDKALYSRESALTFIAQETIQPFSYKEGSRSDTETNEIHFFNLPWPTDLLLEMAQESVKLRITLSYFVEPGAGEIGWKDKYRYQSHGLRFDLNNIGESQDEFRKRVNKAAREEDEELNVNAGSNRWTIGKDNRSSGSIHSDFWQGTAAELATCNHIAIYPVNGWWRERKHLSQVENQTRYSLIISLETPTQEIELYTTVKTMIEVPIEIGTD